MSISTVAVYRDGVLKPADDLRLRENERVTVTITREEGSLPTPDHLNEQVKAWLTKQELCPKQLPVEIPCEQRRRLDAELDHIMEELHRGSSDLSEDEVASDAEEALRTARDA